MGIFSFTQEIAMDLGTANSIIIHNDKIVVDEPSVVAIENKTDKLLAVGTPAHQMEGKEPPGIRIFSCSAAIFLITVSLS